jgi:hypothetical protein
MTRNPNNPLQTRTVAVRGRAVRAAGNRLGCPGQFLIRVVRVVKVVKVILRPALPLHRVTLIR